MVQEENGHKTEIIDQKNLELFNKADIKEENWL